MIKFFLAVIPGVLLLFGIWRYGKMTMQFKKILLKLVGSGALIGIAAAFVFLVTTPLVSLVIPEGTILYLIINNLILIALVEELCKFLALKWLTWKSPYFRCMTDAIVYAVTTSLGFAIFENIVYISGTSVSSMIYRAVLAEPGHAAHAVFMGYFYSLAKGCEVSGDIAGKRKNLRRALLLPTLTHGAYDTCVGLVQSYDAVIMVGLYFTVFIAIMVFAIKLLKKIKKEYPTPVPQGGQNEEV